MDPEGRKSLTIAAKIGQKQRLVRKWLGAELCAAAALLCHAAEAAAKLLPGVDGHRRSIRAGQLHGAKHVRASG
jgi:hypothetical protein